MWCWRRMLRIQWTAKVRNEEIRNQIKEEETLVGRTTRQKLMYFGHVMRGNSLEKSEMTGMGEGARRRGSPRDEVARRSHREHQAVISRPTQCSRRHNRVEKIFHGSHEKSISGHGSDQRSIVI